jgi:glycosyltransferase involved in cell wall biosynthesis
VRKTPLVSITIPTFNSEKVIVACLEGVVKQTYPNIETLVIDSHSTDRTRDIAATYHVRVILCQGKLLAARYLGCKESKGPYVAFLDTDEILEPTAIERAVDMMDDYDMVVFEAQSYNTEWFIPKLHAASKQIINACFGKPGAFDPTRGPFLPRFFKREILEKAFAAIPQELIPGTIHPDHAIIYYECYQASQRVGGLRNGTYEIEPDWRKLWRTQYRYGASLRSIKKSYYGNLLAKKMSFGPSFGRPVIAGLQTLLLSVIIRFIVAIGYYFGRVSQHYVPASTKP